MPLITEVEFNNLKSSIKLASSSLDFNNILSDLISFCQDQNSRALAIQYNDKLQQAGPYVQIRSNLIDIDHVDMLIKLRAGAKAVGEHILVLSYELEIDPFSFDEHYWQLRNEVESLDDSPHASIYQNYFSNNIHARLCAFHPKLYAESLSWNQKTDEEPTNICI